MPALLPLPSRFARILLIVLALAAGSAASANPLPCSNATYNESGVLNGNPYAESGHEVYDGQGCIVLSHRGSDGSGEVEKATSFVSPDGSRFVYTITAAPGSQPTALSGSEVRVAP